MHGPVKTQKEASSTILVGKELVSCGRCEGSWLMLTAEQVVTRQVLLKSQPLPHKVS